MPSRSAQPTRLVIATRESALAMWQAEHVRARLRALYPSCDGRAARPHDAGRPRLDRPLADIGGKGLFIKELEQAMPSGRADLAVHSTQGRADGHARGIHAGGDPRARGSARRAGVAATTRRWRACRPASVVGTSSLRREAQLRERYPDARMRAAARQRQHAPAQARRGRSTPRSSSPSPA